MNGDLERDQELVWGRHEAIAVLKGDRPVNKVLLQRGLERDRLFPQLRALCTQKGAALQIVERPKLDRLTGGASHQGVVVSTAPKAYATLDDVLSAASTSHAPLVLVLDRVEDPHNLGALIRSAEAAGAQGVVIPARRAAGLTGTVAKAAAGALELLPVARVTNLVAAMDALKEVGFWLVGAEADGDRFPHEVDLTVPLALVIGGEDTGLTRLVREHCDFVVRLPMPGRTPSLNASVAGGILLFEAVRQRVIHGKVAPSVPQVE